jgi:hypothetical protein
LEKVVGLRVELSLVRLYEGQQLHDEIRADLEAIGFRLWDINRVFTDPQTRRLLQIDATFFRD